jgi:seryl-tRNA synthetase
MIQHINEIKREAKLPEENKRLKRKVEKLEVKLQSLETELDQLLKTFEHTHVNNGEDDACAECGLDLRNRIHKRIKALEE